MINQKIIKLFQVAPGEKVRLKDHDTGWAQTKELKELGKDAVKERAQDDPGGEPRGSGRGAGAALRRRPLFAS